MARSTTTPVPSSPSRRPRGGGAPRRRRGSPLIPRLLLAVLAAVSLLLPPSVLAKTASGSARLTGSSTEHLLTKFALSPRAVGKVEFSLHSPDMYVDESTLRLRMYSDDEWRQVRKATTCSEKVRYSRKTEKVVFDLNRNPDEEKLNMHGLSKKARGKKAELWEAKIDTSIPGFKSDRPQYWYLAIDDCRLEMAFHDNEVPLLRYTIKVWDDTSGTVVDRDELKKDAVYSHLPADEEGMSKLHLLCASVSVLLGAVLGYKIVSTLMSNSSHHSVHIGVIVVFAACLCDAAASLCEVGHLSVYERNGVGSFALDAMSAHFEALSDSFVAVILLAVGCGWTLPSDVVTGNVLGDGGAAGTSTFVSRLVEGMRTPAGSLLSCGSGSPAGLLTVSVVLAHAALAQWGRTYDSSFDCYHSLENPPGRALMYLRAVLGLAFLAGTASVRNGGRCPPALRPFLTKFAMVGTAWFVSLPFVSTAVMGWVPFHRRHQYLTAGTALVQACSLMSLAWLFTADADASAYHRLSKVVEGGSKGGGGGGLGGDLTDSLAATSSPPPAMGGKKGGARGPPPKMFKLGKAKIRLD